MFLLLLFFGYVPNWQAIAQCETGRYWSANTGNGFWGGLQFLPTSWYESKGENFSGQGPFPFPEKKQIEVAERIYLKQGAKAWPHCFTF